MISLNLYNKYVKSASVIGTYLLLSSTIFTNFPTASDLLLTILCYILAYAIVDIVFTPKHVLFKIIASNAILSIFVVMSKKMINLEFSPLEIYSLISIEDILLMIVYESLYTILFIFIIGPLRIL